MAESGLSVQYSDVQQAVRDYLGDESQDVDRFINAGYRLALHPPPLGERDRPHRWSFLEPVADLDVWPDVAEDADVTVDTGAYDAGSESTPLTASEASFYPTMVNACITLETTGDLVVVSYTSATVVNVAGDQSGEDDGQAFAIASDGLFALPDDYGHPRSPLWYPAGSGIQDCRLVDEGTIRSHRAKLTYTGDPLLFAVVPRKATDGYDPMAGTSGNQARWDALVWPTPSTQWTLTHKYGRLVPNKLDGTTSYPVGGMEFGLLVEAAALAVAEERQRGGKGQMWDDFVAMLAARVSDDRGAWLAVNLGRCTDRSDGGDRLPRTNVSYPTTHHLSGT